MLDSNTKILDSVGVLRVFVRRWKLFVLVFGLSAVIGGIGIAYKSPDSSSAPKIQYAFSFTVKDADLGSAKIPNKQTLQLAIINAKEAITSIKDIQIIEPNYDYGQFWAIFEARSQSEAKEIYTDFKHQITQSKEILAYKKELENLSKFISFPNEKQLLYRGNVYEARIKDIIENGVIFFSELSPANDVYITRGNIGLRAENKRVSPRFMIILLCASSFILGSLAVFIAEFITRHKKAIVS